jgi:hypothetical protein
MLFEIHRAKSSLSRLSFSSTQLENVLPVRRQPIKPNNPIWFGQALFKAINKLHRQKSEFSANLDSLDGVSPRTKPGDLSRLGRAAVSCRPVTRFHLLPSRFARGLSYLSRFHPLTVTYDRCPNARVLECHLWSAPRHQIGVASPLEVGGL